MIARTGIDLGGSDVPAEVLRLAEEVDLSIAPVDRRWQSAGGLRLSSAHSEPRAIYFVGGPT